MSEPMCISCTSPATRRVIDGAFRKPVCDTHGRMYRQQGYRITTPADVAGESEEG